jgi:uncharacterized membrane protein (DUF485 family)
VETAAPAGSSSPWARIASGDYVPWLLFGAALCQFLFFTWRTLDQPIVDMFGFRPAQTAISVPYMLREGAWLANVVPVFGEPWVVAQEFPLYQWCVALLVWATGAPIDAVGRLVSAFFAVANLWPIYLLAKAAALTTTRRFTLLAGALWLLAPVVVFWGRSFLIETTSVFLSLGWLAFYVRFLARRSYVDYLACLGFGALAAVVKIPTFSGFLVVGFIYTCAHVWRRRERFAEERLPLALAAGAVVVSAAALMVWSGYADRFLARNPLAAVLRVSNEPQWYFGTWDDRWSRPLWDWAIRLRDLPEALGGAWYIAAFGLLILAILRNRSFWTAVALIAGYLSVYMLFPVLHIYNAYYQVENVVLLCAAVAVVIDGLLRQGYWIPGFLILAITVVSQTWTLYTGSYGMMLADDLHKHPYYLAGLAIKQATPPDSVIVGFGMGWGADVPYFAERRGIILSGGWPVAAIRQVLFEQRDRWFGGRKLGAVVDCAVFDNQRTDANLAPIRDALEQELAGKTIEIAGSFYGAGVNPPKCQIFLPHE